VPRRRPFLVHSPDPTFAAGTAAGDQSYLGNNYTTGPDPDSDFFECETVELWGVDEAACRRLPLCKDHVELPRAGFFA
jgi:hypothetical protein